MAIAVLAGLAFALPAQADTGAATPSPAAQAEKILETMPEFHLQTAGDTHPIIRITPAKPWLIHLEGQAASVTVDNNSAGLRAVRYGEKSVVLLSRATGSAHITVKGADGGVLMSRSIVIPAPKQKYIRVVTGCSGKGACAASAHIFYCPSLCFETNLARAGLR